MGVANCKVIQLHSGNLGIQGFWMCDIQCGSYRQKRVGLGYSAPCRQIYVVFCVWDICRSLNQPSKLHHPPLYGLACSTTFSWRKIKIKFLTITIGFLAPLVLYAFPWPPNYLLNCYCINILFWCHWQYRACVMFPSSKLWYKTRHLH